MIYFLDLPLILVHDIYVLSRMRKKKKMLKINGADMVLKWFNE
jgi:hypothetical protein